MCCSNKNAFRLMKNGERLNAVVVENPTMDEISQVNNKNMILISMQMMFHQSFESIILFDFWKTTNPTDYFVSCLIIILLGCFTMYLSSINKGYIRKIKKSKKAGNLSLKIKVNNMLLTLLYYLLHYLLMLIAMTFNIGLFISVIVGLSLGYVTFEIGSLEKDVCVCNNESEYPSCC